MFFNEQGIIDIDGMVKAQPSFQKIMEDGAVTDEELYEQSERVMMQLQEAEKRFDKDDLQFIKSLFAEANVLSVLYKYHERQTLK